MCLYEIGATHPLPRFSALGDTHGQVEERRIVAWVRAFRDEPLQHRYALSFIFCVCHVCSVGRGYGTLGFFWHSPPPPLSFPPSCITHPLPPFHLFIRRYIRNRNRYVKLLITMLRARRFDEPFLGRPPTGVLPNFQERWTYPFAGARVCVCVCVCARACVCV